MKKILPVLLLVAVCAGCSTQYRLTLTNGDVITSRGKPKYDAEKGCYYFKDANGETNMIFAGKVREIAPASMADKGGSQFYRK
jgi:hypothetical protein